MKFKNKESGVIYDTEKNLKIEFDSVITVTMDAPDGVRTVGVYSTFSEFCAEWEDCKEPLIKDENSRNVFREWAELFGAELFLVNHLFDSNRKTTSIGSTDITTEPVIELPGHIGEDSQIYTITALCGEQE